MFDAYRSEGHPEISKETGITGVALILTLSTLRVPESFPLDAMHLFYQGVVSRVLVPLLSGTFWKDPPSNDDDGMKVPNPVWARMGRDLADGKKMTPSIYGRYPKNIDIHASKYKAEDWANFLHHYSLPLFKDNIQDDVFIMWNEFAMGTLLATQTEITPSDIDDAETAFATFLNCYYQKVYQRRRDRLAACTYTVHALSHVSQCMRWWGPLSITWQFASERFCGLVISRCKSRVYAAANIHELLKLRAALQAVSRTPNSGISLQNKSHLDDVHSGLLHTTKDLRFLPPKRLYDIQDDAEFDALRSTLAKQLQLRPEDVQIDDDMLSSMYRWDRMSLNGITIGSKSSRFSKRAISRENYFVRIRHQNQQRNTRYTYRDVYAEVFHYLEIKLFP